MKRPFKKSEYFLAGVLAFVAAFPLVTDVSMVGSDLSLAASTLSRGAIRQQALENVQDYRANRRDFQKSRELCQELQAQGSDVTCPDVNDAAGIYTFLSTHKNADPVAVDTEKNILSMSDLNAFQTNLMRRYQKIHTCPETMKGYLPGFYELCQSLLTPAVMLNHGIITGPQNTDEEDTTTLNDMVKVNKGVKRTW